MPPGGSRFKRSSHSSLLKGQSNILAAAKRLYPCLLIFAVSLGVRADDDTNTLPLPPAATNQIVFSRDISPIIQDNCLRCHGPEKPRSSFRLDNRESALKGGDNGMDIVPGNSAKSPLIHYIAYQVEDMEMPPVGRGRKLTPQQVSLLRAWIDQGAAWESPPPDHDVHGFVTTVIGGTTVSGDKYRYQALNWEKTGVMGGEEFQLYQQATPDTRWILNGHVLVPNDYEIDLKVDRNDVGYIHSGWQQFRKYYDDTGGYEPSLVQPAPTLGQDLFLDIGKAWVDFGLTLPHWPQMDLGLEYDYRRGNEATTEWGAVGTDPSTQRNIAPAGENINEGVSIIKFNLNDDIGGTTIADNFRGEFYRLATHGTNTIATLTPQTMNNGTTYFQGANTVRLERKVNDWLFCSAGYLFSRLNSQDSFSMSTLQGSTLLDVTSIPEVTLSRESNVGNLNSLFGPFDGLTISSGILAEWDQQHSFGGGNLDAETLPPPIAQEITPFTVSSTYDEAALQECLSLRYSKIPFTGIYAEARAEQENINQYDQFAAPVEILNKAIFYQHTAFASQLYDVRSGFDTSPHDYVSFGADYRYYEDDSHYTSDPLIQPVQTAYPTFILARDIITHEAEARLVLQPVTRFKATLTYQYQTTKYDDDTRPYLLFGSVISPGGDITGGLEHSHIFSINAFYTPIPRLYFSGLFSYQLSSLITQAYGSPSVVPYQGYVYTALGNGTYVLDANTDLSVEYFFSDANYGQNNYAAGLPLGIEYQQHSIQVSLARRINDSLSATILYRFAYYDEPGSGGATNYRANSILGTLTCRF